jgi:CheY-like chemotaxis protein
MEIKSKRVLFLDDDHSLVLADLSRLGELQIEIDLYTAATTALDAYKKSPKLYDLVVVDLMVDGMWGDEFAARIREINFKQKIIIWTEELGPLSLENRLISKEPVLIKPREIYSFLKTSLEA